MRKRAILCAFFAIPLILFNLLFFLIAGSVHPRSVWISYAWIQFAFILLIVTPWLARRTENGPVYKITLALISGVYCLVEFVVGLVVETRPDTITIERLTELRALGCTKIQLGVQSVDDAILHANGRRETTSFYL